MPMPRPDRCLGAELVLTVLPVCNLNTFKVQKLCAMEKSTFEWYRKGSGIGVNLIVLGWVLWLGCCGLRRVEDVCECVVLL